ncbi:MAG TPA: dihydrofolate reductase [Ideonella sp.]|nr:dihydrofolate reductase [Ideonella sp.]
MNPARPRIALIAAVARNGVIGHDNQLLWRVPEDLAHFRRSTHGGPVLMGRKTWDSLPARFRPLPGRRNLVLTRQAGFEAPGAEPVHSLEQALRLAADAPTLFVIGGEQLYRAALPLADELLLTEIERDFDGDTRFPEWPRAAFAEATRERHQAAPPNDFAFSFVSYRRRPA